MIESGRVNGIGGVFLRSDTPEQLCRWYEEVLGIPFGEKNYSSFLWKNTSDQAPGRTEFAIMKTTSAYFNPSASPFMLNFRVDDLAELIVRLKSAGIPLVGEPETHPYGKFAWIMDPEGNKIELWEPTDSGF